MSVSLRCLRWNIIANPRAAVRPGPQSATTRLAERLVVIVDEDLGLSGASADKRSGFARMISEVALGHVGIILGLGSLAAGAQQCRLVPSSRTMRITVERDSLWRHGSMAGRS